MFRSSLYALFTIALLSQHAQADPFEISVTIKNHVFDPREPKIPANQPVVMTVVNDDDTPEEFESTSLKIEKIVTPKSSIKLRIKALAPGRYEFFGEYNDTAKGALIVE